MSESASTEEDVEHIAVSAIEDVRSVVKAVKHLLVYPALSMLNFATVRRGMPILLRAFNLTMFTVLIVYMIPMFRV